MSCIVQIIFTLAVILLYIFGLISLVFWLTFIIDYDKRSYEAKERYYVNTKTEYYLMLIPFFTIFLYIINKIKYDTEDMT